MSFKDLKLSSDLIRAVEASGFTAPTDIQRQAIPAVLSGRDLMASAQTGTGKTAAFVLPALQRLSIQPAGRCKGPRVLVLTPTRELATQVSEAIARLGRYSRITSGSVVGGVAYPPQRRLLSQALDLLVATPGRLMDHMQQGRIDFSRLEILVLDEADRMLDLGFVDAVRTIAAATPSNRQTLLFSATLEGRVLAIGEELLRNPLCIRLAANRVRHDSIEQRMYRADDAAHKRRLLSHHIASDKVGQAVVFTATKRGADRLAKVLAGEGYAAAALHGDMRQAARRRTVEQVRRGKVRLLVATDVAARGLDIKGLSHVINFDLPMVAEDYIHRIGRTGRAGAAGVAISLVGPEDWTKLVGIERLTGQRLEREVVDGLEPRTPEPRSGRRQTAGRRRGQPSVSRPTGAGERRRGAPPARGVPGASHRTRIAGRHSGAGASPGGRQAQYRPA